MKLNNLKNMFAHSHSTQLNHHISLSRERVELFHIVFIRFIYVHTIWICHAIDDMVKMEMQMEMKSAEEYYYVVLVGFRRDNNKKNGIIYLI